MTALSTRPALLADLPLLSQLWYEKAVLVQQQERRFQLDADARTQWEHVAADWLCDDDSLLLVVAADDGVCGYLLACIRPGLPGMQPQQLGFITEIALDAHRYHGGAARELVEAAFCWFDSRAVRQVAAFVMRSSVIDQAFWRAYGGGKWMECLWIRS
jgi:hypothetical protein